jgi:hypothetical protein
MNGVDDGFNVTERGGPPGSSVIMARNFVSGNFIIAGHSGMWTLGKYTSNPPLPELEPGPEPEPEPVMYRAVSDRLVVLADRDDGSQFVNDTGNVLMYGGCKQNGGNTQTCDHNLILYPGMANRSTGNTCLSSSKFANSYYDNNDCIADHYMGPVAEAPKSAEATYLGFNNRYYLPSAVSADSNGNPIGAVSEECTCDQSPSVSPGSVVGPSYSYD